MKKFLLIFSSIMGILVSAQAAEEISFQVNNTSWSFKTRLACCVDYGDNDKKFNLILEGTTNTKPITTMFYTLSKGAIRSIKLDLTRYDETPEFDDTIETLIADSVFTPDTPSLREIIFTIKENEIEHKAVYG